MIDILCPTRNRIDKVTDMIMSAYSTITDNHIIRFYFYQDTVDAAIEVLAVPGHTTIVGYEHINLSQKWNQCFKLGTGEIVMHCSDDIIFETDGWDEIVIEHFKEHPISLLYGQDGHQNENCPTHSFTSRKAAEHLGYFVPPYFEADWNDVWLQKLYESIGEIYYEPKLITRHLHPNAGYPSDETYEIAKERRKRASLVWNEKQQELNQDKNRLCELV